MTRFGAYMVAMNGDPNKSGDDVVMKTHEFKVVRVPANPRKQTKALNKLAEKGWEVVDTKHLMGAGVTTVHLRRPVAPKAPATAPAAVPLTSTISKPLPPGKPADAYEGRPPVFRNAMAQLFKKK